MPCENTNPHAFEFGKPAQAGEIVAVAAACLVGSETRGVWTCQRPLTQTDLHFAFFSAVANQSCAHQHRIQSAAGQLTNKKHRDRLVRKEEKPTPSKPLRLQQFNTPMRIPCPSPSLRPEQTAYAKEKPARCDARRSMQRRNIHISGASRRLRRHGSWARMPTWVCSLQQQVVRYRHA
jgi:hypothetical protein